MRMDFALAGGRTLVLLHEAYAQMNRYRQRLPWQKEAGGVLLGRHLQDCGDIVIDEVTLPQRQDSRSRTSFYRSGTHNQLARRRWELSGGTVAYLGSWHTHPEGDPSPSSVDLSDWAQAVSRDSYEGSELFFIIVGIEHVRAWARTRGGATHQLTITRRVNTPAER